MADSMQPVEPSPAEGARPAGQPGEAGAESQSRTVSCLVSPSFSEACGLVDSPYSCLVVSTHRRHLALPPRFLSKKRSGIREQLSGELLRYSSRLEGVPVAFDNIKIVGELGDIQDDVGYIHLNIQADFVIFQPQCGQKLVGVVNKVAPSHIGCLVHGCFNASIPKPMKMPIEVWQHVGVKIGDHLEFEVFRLDSDAVGVFCIRGRLDKKIEEEALERSNEAAKTNDPEMSTDNTVKAPEDVEKEASNEANEIPEVTLKRKAKKRHIHENLPEDVTGTSEGWSATSTSLEEIPRKKQKRRHQELHSQAHAVEVDASIDSSSVDNGKMESSILSPENGSGKTRKKKKSKGSLPDADTSGNLQAEESILCGLDNESFVSQEKHKKSKKKKSEDHSDVCLNHSPQNGESELECFGGNPKTVLENTPKTHKKKHKPQSKVLEAANGEADFISEESQPNNLIKQKKNHHNVSHESDSIILPGHAFLEPKAKKKRK